MTGREAGAALRLLLVAAVLLALDMTLVGVLQVAPRPEETAPPTSIKAATYAALDEIRETKRRQLSAYLDRLQAMARQAGHDATLHECFRLQLRFHDLRKASSPPQKILRARRILQQDTLAHAVQNYRGFRDILFVGPEGHVVHNVFQPSPPTSNLLAGPAAVSPLSRRLRATPNQPFVVFDDGAVADEPSAWFVEPMHTDTSPCGWIVMQCSMRRINDIFTRDEYLGRTGETFLVNHDCRMLTSSRFRRKPSILRLHLSPQNIDAKFAEQRGHKLVVDYRGCRAMTSFEVCRMLGSEWLLVAKIDEAEVLTNHYRSHRETLWPALVDAYTPQAAAIDDDPPAQSDGETTSVAMNEFRRAGPGERLATHGVRSCTAILACLPGEFAYLAHASPYDALYGGDDLDLLANMIKRIRRYELPPFRRRSLQVVIIAPHTRSLRQAVDHCVDEGVFLSQIRFAHEPRAARAAVRHDVDSGRTGITWSLPNGTLRQPASRTQSLGEVARRLWLDEAEPAVTTSDP
ncbi:MAG: hypothetical protein GVY16_09630 [Planctomycetes bacterium]|nr:hypothetical protein [Planctomycetota bacterium]